LQIQFYTDSATGLPHIYNHNIDEAEVLDVLEGTHEERAGRDGTRLALGQTSAGRYLRVIYVSGPVQGITFVITAWELTGKALAAFRRRRKKKHQ
jgi:hypothetical protein